MGRHPNDVGGGGEEGEVEVRRMEVWGVGVRKLGNRQSWQCYRQYFTAFRLW